MEEAVFAGGCFWCLQHEFDNLEGVIETVAGYCGGKTKNPTYDKVSTGTTGHVEAVKIFFDPKIIGYINLVIEFLCNIDPTNPIGQFCDIGSQYKPTIFFRNEEQKEIASKCLKTLESSGLFEKPIVVEVKKLENFYPAEDYHQHYWEKYPKLYKNYFTFSGRISYFNDKKPKIKEALKHCK